MPLPREQVFNELNGEEIKLILCQRLRSRLDEVPYLARHLTMPRVRVTFTVKLEVYADQPTPEVHRIEDQLTLTTGSDEPVAPFVIQEIRDVVDASPGLESQGHKPPDQIRYEAGLPIAVPVKQLGLPVADEMVLPGVTIERGADAGGQAGTRIVQDYGPRSGLLAERDTLALRNRGRGEPGPIQPDFRDSRKP